MKKPDAFANIIGGKDNNKICGKVLFFQMKNSVLVRAIISNLPDTKAMFYGFHIHDGNSCKGDGFPETDGHYDKEENPHPLHSGDMPPLLSCGRNAYMEFKTDRFCVKDIIGKTVVIHGGADDFRTQPSGDAGKKIACGVICRV